MSNSSKTTEKNKLNRFQKRPEGISDFEISWAIRDIPRSILNLPRKGILLVFAAIIGNRKSYKSCMKNLEEPMGASERQLRDHFIYLEDQDFLIIERPKNYVRGLVNEYGLNYELILSTGKRVSCDKV
jgi:hypothetical protein